MDSMEYLKLIESVRRKANAVDFIQLCDEALRRLQCENMAPRGLIIDDKGAIKKLSTDKNVDTPVDKTAVHKPAVDSSVDKNVDRKEYKRKWMAAQRALKDDQDSTADKKGKTKTGTPSSDIRGDKAVD